MSSPTAADRFGADRLPRHLLDDAVLPVMVEVLCHGPTKRRGAAGEGRCKHPVGWLWIRRDDHQLMYTARERTRQPHRTAHPRWFAAGNGRPLVTTTTPFQELPGAVDTFCQACGRRGTVARQALRHAFDLELADRRDRPATPARHAAKRLPATPVPQPART